VATKFLKLGKESWRSKGGLKGKMIGADLTAGFIKTRASMSRVLAFSDSALHGMPLSIASF